MNDEDKTMIEEAEKLGALPYALTPVQTARLLPRLAARLRAVLEELNDAKNERDAAFRMLANPNLDNTVR